MNLLLDTLGPTLGPLVALVIAVLVGLALHGLLFRVVRRLTTEMPDVLVFQGALLRRIRRPLALLLPLIVVRLWLPLAARALTRQTILFISDVLYIGAVVAVAWLLIGVIRAFEDLLVERSDIEADDNLDARKMLTQVKILKRVAVVVIAVLALAAILMHYEAFREIGTGLLASAGAAGLIIGLAAQRALGNLLAGLQLAITQPIRVDDVVIVEGDFGRVEEITLTYIVVRVWDQRRIVVPVSDVLEKPFQNWTRTSAELMGTVFLYVDYTVPVEALRSEHQRILEASEEWDERVAVVQVTDASERAAEVRLLQSAPNASQLFGLRCRVREKMIAFVQREYPDALPKVRAQMQDGDATLPGGPQSETHADAHAGTEAQAGTDAQAGASTGEQSAERS
ncbi:MAG: mechanosensitive ion channel protein MscS [Bacteroidetes bacterium QH_9_67_14]|nr:MAG: mechanosensitive ion channel protein MscS [Bacteroidetes bacterium QH_9_67_14]